jgi:shikimate kinase
MTNHILLIGFKHVGKSAVGANLAKKLNHPFIDSDQAIESLYQTRFNKKSTCREIMQQHGEVFFRQLEITALQQILDQPRAIIALGGGTPLSAENQQVICDHQLIHLTAPYDIVFERIINNGAPAFLAATDHLTESLTRLWEQRNKIYDAIKHLTIHNNGSIDEAADKIIKELNLKRGL